MTKIDVLVLICLKLVVTKVVYQAPPSIFLFFCPFVLILHRAEKKHLFTQYTCCYPAFFESGITLEDVLFFYLERSAMPTLAHVK